MYYAFSLLHFLFMADILFKIKGSLYIKNKDPLRKSSTFVVD